MREEETNPWEEVPSADPTPEGETTSAGYAINVDRSEGQNDAFLWATASGDRRPEPMRVCINTQTPLVQFAPGVNGGHAMWELEPDLAKLVEGEDYRFSPGGVTRMVYPLAKRLLAEGVWQEVHWVALNPQAPETVRVADGITLHNVAVSPDRLGGYGKAKEAIWRRVHGVPSPGYPKELFWTDDFTGYTYYNRTTAELIRELDRCVDFDVFYIHDFQQLPVGQMLGTVKPKLFRWHIPFDARAIPASWRVPISTYLSAYDLVVVSADRYRAALKRYGHHGPVALLYPYVDPSDYGRPNETETQVTCQRFGIPADADVVLVVARMDPAKGQDRAIAAVAQLSRPFPRLRLVLAGNGSFSNSRVGLRLSKSDSWRRHLEEVAESRGISERVVFTGHVSQRELECLYQRAAFTVLPSVREGFGLVVVESWLYGKPAVVSRRAGISELIDDGQNGLLFDPDDPWGLERAMARLLRDSGPLRERLCRHGQRTARRCSIEAAVRGEARLFRRIQGG